VMPGRAAPGSSIPFPDAFYTGDAEPAEHVALLRDYYAWTGVIGVRGYGPFWPSRYR
jgi:hypothetical protein